MESYHPLAHCACFVPVLGHREVDTQLVQEGRPASVFSLLFILLWKWVFHRVGGGGVSFSPVPTFPFLSDLSLFHVQSKFLLDGGHP